MKRLSFPKDLDLEKHRNGAEQIWSWCRYKGEIVPIVACDDQYCLQFSDGSRQWVQKWDVESLFWERSEEEIAEMKARYVRFGVNKPTERSKPTSKKS